MTHFMDASVALYDQGVADEKARRDAEVAELKSFLKEIAKSTSDHTTTDLIDEYLAATEPKP